MSRLSAGLALVVVAVLATTTPALAHANLVRSNPSANASLDKGPARIKLWFSEQPEPRLTEIQVFDSQRQRLDAGPAQVAADDAKALVEPVKPELPQGVYTVSWRATSAIDGHVTGGAFAFGVGATPTAADISAATLASQQPAPTPLDVAIGWLTYLGSAGLLGLALFSLLVVEPESLSLLNGPWAEQVGRRLRLLGQGLAALLLATAVAQHHGAGLVKSLGTRLGDISLAQLALSVFVTALLIFDGQVLVPRALARRRSLGAAAAQPVVRAGRIDVMRPLLITATLGLLLLLALTSHAQTVATAPELALFVDWLHLTVAGVWVGGLLALAACVVPVLGSGAKPTASVQVGDGEANELFGPLVTAFSRVALISVIGLVVTGSYQALVHVGSVDNAVSTPYGRTLIAKSAIFALALLLAAFHRWWLVPALAQPSRAAATRARRFFSRTLPLEAFLAVAILGATGLLTSLAPANDQAGGQAQTKTMGAAQVTFQVMPLRVGSNLFQVTVRSKGQPVDNADKVELQVTMLDMSMGQSVLDLQPKGQGVYAAQSDLLGMSGHWGLDLLLRLPGQLDQRATFDVQVPV
ncbi:MAG TPA: copper resistance protein CopC [Chloroflexota bacterium]|nr:copper resistance protein CopC [Chloroflexota bacterium]